jgi:hypothetical protein
MKKSVWFDPYIVHEFSYLDRTMFEILYHVKCLPMFCTMYSPVLHINSDRQLLVAFSCFSIRIDVSQMSLKNSIFKYLFLKAFIFNSSHDIYVVIYGGPSPTLWIQTVIRTEPQSSALKVN